MSDYALTQPMLGFTIGAEQEKEDTSSKVKMWSDTPKPVIENNDIVSEGNIRSIDYIIDCIDQLKTEIKSLYKSAKIKLLHNIIISELNKKAKTIKLSDKYYMELITTLSGLAYNKAVVDFSFNKNIHINLKFNKERSLYINLILSKLSTVKKQAFFAYYENKICLFNGCGSIKNVISDIKLLREKIPETSIN